MDSSNKNRERPIGIDLFAGAGGLSLGFEQAGFDIAAAVEIDPIHCATHEFNFPNTVTICASVVDLTGDELRRRAGLEEADIEVVFGGAPCQGFSMIGKRALDDPRNQLVFHYVRLVQEIRPRYCVFENVKGLTLGKHTNFLSELIADLEDSGYDMLLPYQILNAADYGTPQNRKRLFLIGTRRGLPLPQYPAQYIVDDKASDKKHSLPLFLYPPRQHAPGRTTVVDAIGDLPDADAFVELNSSDAVSVRWETSGPYARRLRGLDSDPTDFSYRRGFDRDALTSSTRTQHTPLSKERFLSTPNGKTEPVSRFYKLDSSGQCNTLRAGTDSARGAFTSPRPIHPSLPRVITVREAARLHSYPDWFRFHVTKWHGFRQIGNSVPPLLGRAIAAEIIEALGIHPTIPSGTLNLGDVALLSLDMGAASRRFAVPRDTIAQRTRKTNMPSLRLCR